MRLSAGSAAILAFGAASPGPQFSNMLTTFALSGLVGVQVSTQRTVYMLHDAIK
jgi:hypothetical protein